MPPTAWRAIVAALLTPVLAMPLAQAAATGDEWDDDPRAVTAWPDGGGFVLRSTRDSAAGNDELAVDYDARSAMLAVTLQAVDPSPATLAMVLAIQAVTEFQDEDGDGRYSLGEPVVRRVEVPGTPATSSVQALPGGGWRATATHALPPPSGALQTGAATARLEVAVAAYPEAQDGHAPTRFDLDLRVIDGWARNGTHLAVEAAVDASSDPAHVDADVARLRSGEHELAAAWQDGRGSVVEGTDARALTFVRAQPAAHVVSFPAALAAGWTPAGADGARGPGGDLLLYVGAAALAAAAFLVPAWRRLRSA